MITSLILLAFGLFFIFIEFYLPGGIMAVLGGIMILASLVTFAMQSQYPVATILFFIASGASLALLIKLTLKNIQKAKPGNSIYLHGDQKGYQASEFDASAIGKNGVVLSDLKPGGYILVDNKKHQAVSVSGYIAKGEEVVVISGQEESLIVRTYNEDKLS